MYSESDIEAAIAAGALTPEAAAALRASVAAGRAAPAVDEESFRLLTGFNDIFVSIALVLFLVALGWIGGTIGNALITMPSTPPNFMLFHGTPEQHIAARQKVHLATLLGSLFVCGSSWLLAEYFTRKRRMALPSILLLAAFGLSAGGIMSGFLRFMTAHDSVQEFAESTAVASLISIGALYLHWLRFHVPIAVAALTAAMATSVVSMCFAAVPELRDAWLFVLLLAGLATFAFAMWWDMSDRARITRRSDVAFWLHLAAAPMIAHPIFNLLGVLGDHVGAGTAVVVILLYLVFGVVALAVDRRALLVSGLVYVLYALAGLFRQFGAVSLSVALTALVIGSALLLLSAFWHDARRRIVVRLPGDLAARLPTLDRPALTPRPA